MLKFLQSSIFAVLLFAAVFNLTSCTASYPDAKLEDAVRELFKKELDSPVTVKRVGGTLYAGIEIQKMVDKNLSINTDTFAKLESALLSISRIALSTDAKIDYVVVQVADQTSGMVISIVRKMQDLRDLFYWRISRADFEERMIFETERLAEKKQSGQNLLDGTLWGMPWQEITPDIYFYRLVISRLNLQLRSNMFLKILAGNADSFNGTYDSFNGVFTLNLVQAEDPVLTSDHLSEFLKEAILKEMQAIETKYLSRDNKKSKWAKTVIVKNSQGKILAEFVQKDWLNRPAQDATKI